MVANCIISPLLAFLVPWRAVTWEISWAITPASSDSSCAQNQAAIDVEESAGQREGVDFVGVDDFDSERHARVGVAHQVLSHAVHIFGDYGIINHLGRALDFLGKSLAERDFTFEGVEVDALADAAIADGVDVFLGVLRTYRILLLHRSALRG